MKEKLQKGMKLILVTLYVGFTGTVIAQAVSYTHLTLPTIYSV